MRAVLLVVGKTTDSHLSALIDDYVGRVKHYMPFTVSVVGAGRHSKALPREQQKVSEGVQILRHLGASDYVVLLDARGTALSSPAFATWLARRQQSPQTVVFVIGGAYGFAAEVYARANEQLSLSAMTFSHQLVRLLFAEQLYRACTIIKGEAYHHE